MRGDVYQHLADDWKYVMWCPVFIPLNVFLQSTDKSVNQGSSTCAFGASFQGYRGLGDVEILGNSYIGQEKFFNPMLLWLSDTKCSLLGLYWK